MSAEELEDEFQEFSTEEQLPGRRGGASRVGGAYNISVNVKTAQTQTLSSLKKAFDTLEKVGGLYEQAHTYLENCEQIRVMNMLTLAHVIQYLQEIGYNPQNSSEPRLNYDEKMERHISKLISDLGGSKRDDVTRMTKGFIATFQRYANLYHKFARGHNPTDAIEEYRANNLVGQ